MKGEKMNLRTKITTIAAVATFTNLCVAAFNESVLDGYPKAQAAYKITSAALAAVSWAFSHYYNMDFTEEACQGTGMTRLLKDQKKSNDKVFTEPGKPETLEEIEEVEDHE